MTWKDAYDFCTEEGGRFPNSIEVQMIGTHSSTLLPNGTQFWIYENKNDSLDWVWPNGTLFRPTQFKGASNKMGNTSGERCAYVYEENNTKVLKDSSCDECRWFFCKRCEVRSINRILYFNRCFPFLAIRSYGAFHSRFSGIT
jgi:hypothetical protein